MSRRFYIITRDLHLYLGLFFAPFVLVFAFSVFFLVHSWIPGVETQPGELSFMQKVVVPSNIESLDGRQRVDAVRSMLGQIGISGEVGFIRHIPEEHRLVVPVSAPGRETVVTIDLEAQSASVVQRTTGTWDALVTLHKAPGPHLEAIRMNWFPMRLWRGFADATAYLLFFISISGIYLWTVLRSERRVGLALIAAGTFSFLGIVFAIAH